MKDLKAQLAEMSLDRLISATHDYALTHDEIPDDYVRELLHRVTRLRARNRELSKQVGRLSKAPVGTPGDRLRREINANVKSIRAICDRITSDTRHIR